MSTERQSTRYGCIYGPLNGVMAVSLDARLAVKSSLSATNNVKKELTSLDPSAIDARWTAMPAEPPCHAICAKRLCKTKQRRYKRWRWHDKPSTATPLKYQSAWLYQCSTTWDQSQSPVLIVYHAYRQCILVAKPVSARCRSLDWATLSQCSSGITGKAKIGDPDPHNLWYNVI